MSEKTLRFRLDAIGRTPKDREEVRRYFWELMADQQTPLINQLYLKVAQHPQFSVWQSEGVADDDEVKRLWRSFEQDPQFQTMPERAFVSGRLNVENTYKSWLALQVDRQEAVDKLLHSVEVLKSDVELVTISNCPLDELRCKATEILSQVNAQVVSNGKKKTKKAMEGGIYKILYDKHRKTDDLVEQCAIAYLIKNRFKIKGDETEEDLKKLSERIHSKKKEIEILQKQLKSCLPKGRLWVNKDILEEVQLIGVVEDETKWNSIESALLKQQKFMPHPILFHSSDDLIWSESKKFVSEDSQPEDFKSKRSERVCVCFKSFDEKYAFEVSGGHRDFHILQQALKERTIYESDTDANTSKLFVVRSATFIWEEYKKNENRIVRRRKAANKRAKRDGQPVAKGAESISAPEHYNPEFPWNRYQLFLHCTVKTQFLTQEGTERFIEQQRKSIVKALQTLENNIAQLEEKGESAQTRKARHSRQTGTLRRMDSYDNNYERPSKPLYIGHPHIITGVALGSGGLVTATIVDATANKVIECRGLKALLGKNYKLVNRRQFECQQNSRRRTTNQKRGANSQFGESKLGAAIDQHTANAVIEFAKQHQSACIVLPDMKDYRIRQQAAIAALAEQECGGWKGVEKQFAKAQNLKIHSWSYGRLIKYIAHQAAQQGIEVKIGRQPIEGSSQEQAGKMAIEVYQTQTKPKKTQRKKSA
jgi:hypothetical protein